MADIFYSPLSSLISRDNVPEKLSFISDGIDNLLSNVYYRNLHVFSALNHSSAHYELDLVIYSNLLKLEVPGTGIV